MFRDDNGDHIMCSESVKRTGQTCASCARRGKDGAAYHAAWKQWERDISAWNPPQCAELPPEQWTMKEVRYAREIRDAIEAMSEDDRAKSARVSPTLWPLLMKCLDDLRTWEGF